MIRSMNLPPGLSVVVPVYKSGEILDSLAAELERVLPKCAQDYEVILVDDGSGDGTWDVVQRLSAEHPRFRGIRLFRNFGQHNATLCGMRSARFATTLTLDDDLQNPPEEIPKLLAELSNGSDVVFGRPVRQRQPWYHLLSAFVIKSLSSGPLGLPAFRHRSAFRAFRTPLRCAFEGFQGPAVSVDYLLTLATRKFTSVIVAHHPRTRGRTTYSLRRRANEALLAFTFTSTAPLRLATLLGLAFAAAGAATLVVLAIRWLSVGSPAGWPLLAAVMGIIGGAQLFCLGIFGEYVGRIYLRSLGAPTFVIADTTESSPGAHDAASPGLPA